MKMLKIASVACAVGFVCCLIAGCAGESRSSENEVVGSWVLYEIEGEDGTDAETVQGMLDAGFDISLKLNEDNTASLVLFGETMEGTWESKGGSSAVLSFSGDEANVSIKDGRLEMEQEGGKIVFQRSATSSASSDSATSSSLDSAGNGQQAASSSGQESSSSSAA